MKKILLSLVFSIILMLIIVTCFFNYFSVKKVLLEESPKNFKYHFAVVLTDKRKKYWENMTFEINKIAKELDIAISFYDLNDPNSDYDLYHVLEMLKYTKIDGIIVIPENNEKFITIVEELDRSKIPIVTIVNDNSKSKRKAFIGINSFETGENLAKFLSSEIQKKLKVAIIINDEKNNIFNEKEFIIGIESLKDETFEKFIIKKSGFESIGAEKATIEILNDNPDINIIISTNYNMTIGTARAIIDLNKVGDINIIGFGESSSMIDLIKKDIIYGTFTTNVQHIAQESIKTLIKIKNRDQFESEKYTTLKIITKKTLIKPIN